MLGQMLCVLFNHVTMMLPDCRSFFFFLSKLIFFFLRRLIELLKFSFLYSFAGSHLHYLLYKPKQYPSLHFYRYCVIMNFRDSPQRDTVISGTHCSWYVLWVDKSRSSGWMVDLWGGGQTAFTSYSHTRTTVLAAEQLLQCPVRQNGSLSCPSTPTPHALFLGAGWGLAP